MEHWYKVVTLRQEVREGRSFSPDEFAIAVEQVLAKQSAGGGRLSSLPRRMPRAVDLKNSGRGFGQVRQGFESCRVVNGHLRQHLPVQGHVGFGQFMDKPAVR